MKNLSLRKMAAIQEEIKSLLGRDALKTDWIKIAEVNANPNKPQNVHHQIEISLDKLYTGMSVRIRADKKTPCTSCARGIKKHSCAVCSSTGRSDPGILNNCTNCDGKGFRLLTCDVCFGQGTLQKEKYHAVTIPRGARNGHQIWIKGEGDTMLNQPDAASDIVCTIKEQPHSNFRRCGHDLYIQKNISITNALCGLKLVFTHLDGRKIVLKTQPGTVIRTGDMLCAKNEGMPVLNSKTGAKGDLIVMFNVLFPKKFEDLSVLQNIENYLPKRTSPDIASKDLEEFDLTHFDPKEIVYAVPYRQQETYEDSPAKKKTEQKEEPEKLPTCAQQ
uniref:dnaJ homolog subfamily A member 4-like isoform X2 n=1 Tax=Styela clava TaxID=7725 RepID=UPI0019397839|nr:dnaJ homolog subfamily A member 4-like isoform X2 [Styela clava]